MRGMSVVVGGVLVLGTAGPAVAQVRSSQPAVLEIVREMVKPGRGGPHGVVEKEWAAFGRHHEAPGYVALNASTGPSEAWFLFGYNSWAAYDSAEAYGGKDPTYGAGNRRLAEQDGEHLNGTSEVLASAVPEAGYGAFPDLGAMRVYQVVIFRMRMGQEAAFTELAKGYAGIAKTSPGVAGWRTYVVEAGIPGPTYLVIETFPSFAARAASSKAMDAAVAATPKATMAALQKLGTDAIASIETRIFTVAPGMSNPPREWLSDPFWKP